MGARPRRDPAGTDFGRRGNYGNNGCGASWRSLSTSQRRHAGRSSRPEHRSDQQIASASANENPRCCRSIAGSAKCRSFILAARFFFRGWGTFKVWRALAMPRPSRPREGDGTGLRQRRGLRVGACRRRKLRGLNDAWPDRLRPTTRLRPPSYGTAGHPEPETPRRMPKQHGCRPVDRRILRTQNL